MITITNEDNMTLMARYPDNYFDLAIVDPPYGLGFDSFNRTNKHKNGVRYKSNKYKSANWDSEIPTNEYFKELFRVSKHQIIWGGNYFPSLWQIGCKGFIFWAKHNPVPNFADGELAWTSFNTTAKQFSYKYFGKVQGNTSAEKRYHPTQKPVALYKWLLQTFVPKLANKNEGGVKLLDTHLGSGSIAIACHDLGFNLTACELDIDYYNAAIHRLKMHTETEYKVEEIKKLTGQTDLFI